MYDTQGKKKKNKKTLMKKNPHVAPGSSIKTKTRYFIHSAILLSVPHGYF